MKNKQDGFIVNLGVEPFANTDTVKVTNASALTGLAAKSADETKAKAALSGDTITITGVAAGETTCAVTATGAKAASIKITVNAAPEVQLDKTETTVDAPAGK